MRSITMLLRTDTIYYNLHIGKGKICMIYDILITSCFGVTLHATRHCTLVCIMRLYSIPNIVFFSAQTLIRKKSRGGGEHEHDIVDTRA